MSYASLAVAVVEHVRAANPNRIVSIDLETKVLSGDFLSGEPVLGVSLAWREGSSVKGETLVATEESEIAEVRLFEELDSIFLQLRPLILVGYYLTHYDYPLLSMKMRKVPRPLWGIENGITRAFILDLKDPVRFELGSCEGLPPRAQSLDRVVEHSRFSHLPLMKTRKLAQSPNRESKGERIYDLWKNDPEGFKLYSRGDAHDTLLIFEDLFPFNSKSRLGLQTV